MAENRFMKYNMKVLSIAGGDSKITIDSAIVANQKNLRGFAEGTTVLAPGSYSASQLLSIIKQEFPAYVPPKRYTITATVDPTGAGNVSGTGTFDEGSICTLSASPVGKYVFKYWDADPAKTANPLVITVTGNEQHIAKFEETVDPTYTVTLTDDGHGTATATPSTAAAGTQIVLSQSPNEGYHFLKWESDDVTVSGNSFTMPANNVTVKAVFEQDAPTSERMYKNAYVQLTRGAAIPVPSEDNLTLGDYTEMTADEIASMKANGTTLEFGDGVRKNYAPCFLYPKTMGQLTSIDQGGIQVISTWDTIPYTVDGQEYWLSYKKDTLVTSSSKPSFNFKW